MSAAASLSIIFAKGRSVSLRTTDFSTAKQSLTDWFIANNKPFLRDDLELARCLVEYYTQHACDLKRKNAEKRNLRYWLEFFPELNLKDLTAARQRDFIKSLQKKKLAKSTIQGIFKTGVSAANFAWREQMITSKIPFLDTARELKKYRTKSKARWRAIEIDEMVSMFENSNNDRLTRYLMLLIGGASRSSAGIEISGQNIDLKAGTINLLHDGEEQTNKYRATVKLPSFIRAIYHKDNICSQSEVVPNINNLRNRYWIPARERAKLDKEIVPYSVRHGIAKWLRSQSVDPWHVSTQLGHKRKGSETTEIYASYDPDYLTDVLRAIEDYFSIIYNKSPKLREFLSGTGYDSRCDVVAKSKGEN